MKKDLSAEQLQSAVGIICKVIGQIPCYHVFEEFVVERFGQDTPEVSVMSIMHNATLDSALVNLRCFNEFFKLGGRSDDLRSHHFSNLVMQPFLDEADEQAINKFLAHLTQPRMDMIAMPWGLDRMTLLGLRHGIQFLTYVERGISLPSPSAVAEVQDVLKGCRLFMARIEKRHRSPA